MSDDNLLRRLTKESPTLAREVEELYTAVARKALHHAADTMPIETLLGADKASVWLREYAERWGTK